MTIINKLVIEAVRAQHADAQNDLEAIDMHIYELGKEIRKMDGSNSDYAVKTAEFIYCEVLRERLNLALVNDLRRVSSN